MTMYGDTITVKYPISAARFVIDTVDELTRLAPQFAMLTEYQQMAIVDDVRVMGNTENICSMTMCAAELVRRVGAKNMRAYAKTLLAGNALKGQMVIRGEFSNAPNS